ncbi:phosphoribosylglycinamide formyltransferase [Apibacter raozihei]|uniref:phosphoribosylglycinamide formyltransferase n=1 Tax=Apibacter TaxID=1778601 RepID=UPI000FE3FA1B|nr:MULTISPECIES: phosphoribosylglycinamide formyltransferase [Apibacter]
MNIAVLVSGGGTNLQRILDALESGELIDCNLQSVIADRDCYAIERALDKDISTFLLERGKNLSVDIDHILEDQNIDIIVLAGFLSILSVEFCHKWSGKIINIHPSLLPKFGGKGMYGAKVHQAVLDAGEVESGATVHFVTQGIDEGEIILQGTFSIDKNDTVADLQQKVMIVEQKILIEAINSLSSKNK